jgi:hypothetical protein
MTDVGATVAAFLAGGAVALGGALAGGSAEPASYTALVIDAAAGRDGRQLLDGRLRDAEAVVRLPRSSAEALTDVRYLAAQGYRLVVSGPHASAAAREAGVSARSAPSLESALAAAR